MSNNALSALGNNHTYARVINTKDSEERHDGKRFGNCVKLEEMLF
jgi:hypothetical protein